MNMRLTMIVSLVATVVQATEAVVQIGSFNPDGQLTFNEVSNASGYRVEWAPSPEGPWTSFSGATSAWLAGIPSNGSGTIITAAVPMVYRVLATMGLPDMVSIPAGSYAMGSPPDEPGRNADETVHPVTLTHGFFMQRTEVTNRQMADVLNWALGQGLVRVDGDTVVNTEGDQQPLLDMSSVYLQLAWTGAEFVVDAGKDLHPCITVNWFCAQAYCNYLSDIQGLDRAVTFHDWGIHTDRNGYRLPTEAEWEYACRAGTADAFNNGGITYTGVSPLDPNLDAAGWYQGNSYVATDPMWQGKAPHAVGQKQPNAWGLYDMHGNALEWCLDWYGEYPWGAVTDPTGPSSGSLGVLRGGSWSFAAMNCRSAARRSLDPFFGYNWNGLRPVRRSASSGPQGAPPWIPGAGGN